MLTPSGATELSTELTSAGAGAAEVGSYASGFFFDAPQPMMLSAKSAVHVGCLDRSFTLRPTGYSLGGLSETLRVSLG